MASSVPIVDFSAYSLDRDEPDPALFQKLIDDLYVAFTTMGFAYIKNYHGVLDEKVNCMIMMQLAFNKGY